MVATVAGIHLGIDTHANRPAANTVPDGSIYSCSTHSLVYKSNFAGNSWATWATLGGSETLGATIMDAKGDIIGASAADTPARLAVGTNGQVLTADSAQSLGIKWADATGGAATDPTIPSGGTLYDGQVTTGWTAFGASVTFDADLTVADHFYVRKASMGTGETVGFYRAVGGSFPRTYTMRLNDHYLSNDFAGAGLLVSEATPGKVLSLVNYKNGASKLLQRIVWTNPTTSSAQVDFPSTQDHHIHPPLWLRFVVTSSTSIAGLWSRSGYLYTPLFSAFDPVMTVGSFGFAMSSFAAIDLAAAIKWIHES